MFKKLLLASLLALAATLAFAQGSAKIAPAAARDLLAKDKTIALIDVRTADEFATGHIKGAKLLPYDSIDTKSAASLIKDKNQTVVVYCRSGHRSGIAATTLAKLGYTNVLDLGGLLQWPYELVKGKE
jgi:rhodanese-related sulfurtransferase